MDWSGLSIFMENQEMEMNSDLIHSIKIFVLHEVREHSSFKQYIEDDLFLNQLQKGFLFQRIPCLKTEQM